jgi:hypothetical protein
MTRSFPMVSRLGEMFRGATSIDSAGHGATGGDNDVPDWVVMGRARRLDHAAEQMRVLLPRMGRLC